MPNLFLDKNLLELNAGLKIKEFSFSDLANETIQAIERFEPHTHAWTIYNNFELKETALELDRQELAEADFKPLTGIPFGIKDIFNTKSFKTQMGSPIWKDFNPGNNARVVDSVLEAGGLIVGKTVTAEFAVHALNETVNPHDVTKTPGTSSSGSAAAVARGMVPFALGTQTAGSIIRPASFCGVWGMKPSFGMIPRTGVLKTTDSLDSIGFLAAHGKSLRVLLDVVRVKGPDYPFVYKNVDAAGSYPKKSDRKWNVGFVKTHTWDTAENYAKDAISRLVDKIAETEGFELKVLDWPSSLSGAHKIHSNIYSKSLAYYFKQEARFTSEVSEVMQEMIQEGAEISIKEYQTSLLQQDQLIDDLDNFLKPYDFVISLGTSSSAPPRGDEELPDPSLIWTLGHIPSIAVPVFRCPEGLPFGAQFVSRRWNDYTLLQGVEELIDGGILPAGSIAVNS
jgi:Asp-tRNA(Asn)/Glu-tRNA(Gln) amidotransferase A subunit family amidase